METVVQEEVVVRERIRHHAEGPHVILDPLENPELSRSHPDRTFDYSTVHYSLLPILGRHEEAVYTLCLEVSEKPPEIPKEVGNHVTTGKLKLETELNSLSDTIFLKGIYDEEITIFDPEPLESDVWMFYPFSHTHLLSDWEDRIGEFNTYDYLIIRLEYDERFRDDQDPDSEKLTTARQEFADNIERENEKIPFTFDPDAQLF